MEAGAVTSQSAAGARAPRAGGCGAEEGAMGGHQGAPLQAPRRRRRAMGCVESNEALSTPDLDEEEAKPSPPPPAPPAPEKGKKRRKSSTKSRRTSEKDTLDPENARLRSGSTKITVIWRRYSVFSRRDSMKSSKSQEEGAGPSQKPLEEPEAASSSA